MTAADHVSAPEDTMPDLMLRACDLPPLTGLSPSTIRRHVAKHRFPAPVRLSTKAIGWRARDVQAWQASRPVVDRARRGPAGGSHA